MSVMQCPETGCENKVSITAKSCPSCGFRLQNFFKNSLEKESIGIPVHPANYWMEWHIWYWWGCGGLDLEFTQDKWVNTGDKIISIGSSIEIYSPFTGLITNSNNELELGKCFQVSEHYQSETFIKMRILKGTFHESIGHRYGNLQQYILHKAEEYSPGTLRYWWNDHILGLGIDPKSKFNSYEDFIEKARDLSEIKAIRFK